MDNLVSTWWGMTSAYFAGPAALIGGRVSVLNALPVVGIVLVILGIFLAIRMREAQARWLALPALATLAAPIIVTIAYDIMGWFGVLFALVIGGVGLLGWVGGIGIDARKRLPIWLIGFGLMTFVLSCAAIAIGAIW